MIIINGIHIDSTSSWAIFDVNVQKRSNLLARCVGISCVPSHSKTRDETRRDFDFIELRKKSTTNSRKNYLQLSYIVVSSWKNSVWFQNMPKRATL